MIYRPEASLCRIGRKMHRGSVHKNFLGLRTSLDSSIEALCELRVYESLKLPGGFCIHNGAFCIVNNPREV